MVFVDSSNYVNIELAVANLIQVQWPGMPVYTGDYSKIVEGTPCAVVSHGEMRSTVEDRFPQFEWLYYQIPVHIFFDYNDDLEAHRLFRDYRADMIVLFQKHRYLDDGNTYPQGKLGQADDCKIVRAFLPQYITIDGKDYVQSTYELWVAEKVRVIY